MFRAVPLSKSSVVQPSLWARLGESTTMFWSNVPFKKQDKIYESEDGWKYPTEARLSTSYKFNFDNFTFEPKFTYFEFSPKNWAAFCEFNFNFYYTYNLQSEIDTVFFKNH